MNKRSKKKLQKERKIFLKIVVSLIYSNKKLTSLVLKIKGNKL